MMKRKAFKALLVLLIALVVCFFSPEQSRH